VLYIFGRIRDFFTGRNSGTEDAHMSNDKRLVLQLSDKRLPSMRQLKHLSRLLSPTEKRTVHSLLAILFVCLFGIGAKFLNDRMESVPADGGEYIEASVGNPRFVNPVLASTNDADLDLVKLIFSGLMRTDSKGAIVPDLAASYEISEDGKTYTFHLRENIQWHDGGSFSSKDVVATAGYIKDPDWKSPLAASLKNVSVEAPNDRTVKFVLNEPFAPFLSLLTFGILPEHLWSDVRADNSARAELNIKPIGTGPFKFKSFTKDKKGAIHTYILTRNQDFYAQKTHLDTFAFRFYEDFGSALDALSSHKVDGLSFLPLEYHDTAVKLRSSNAYALRLPQYTAVFLNQKHNSTLRSKEVRQALAMATDREAVRTSTGRTDSLLVNGPILSGFVGFHPDVKKIDFNPGAAAALLEKAGWMLGENGFRQKKSIDDKKKPVELPLVITITTVDAKEYVAAANAVKKSWEAIGIKTEMDLVPSARIQKDKIRTRDYDAIIYGEILGIDPDPYPFWHSSQGDASGLNLASYSNRRVDELLEKARGATQQDARAPMYREFQDILADEIPAIFLYSPNYTYLVGKKIKGVGTEAIFTPADRLTDAAAWYQKTTRVWRR